MITVFVSVLGFGIVFFLFSFFVFFFPAVFCLDPSTFILSLAHNPYLELKPKKERKLDPLKGLRSCGFEGLRVWVVHGLRRGSWFQELYVTSNHNPYP
jgi:hypothetical protein